MLKSQIEPVIVPEDFYEVSPSLLTVLDRGELTRTILECARRALHATGGALALALRESTELHVEFSNPHGSLDQAAVTAWAQQVMQTREGLCDLFPPRGDSSGEGAEVSAGSVLALPLEADGVPSGALVLWREKTEVPFAINDFRAGKRLAAEIAIALDDARLRQELSRKAQTLEEAHVAVARAEAHAHERKRSEEALRESEERYRLLFENTLAGVFRTTPDGRSLNCNQALANMLGYDSPREVLAHPVLDFYFSEDDRRKFLEKLNTERSLSNFEMRLRRKDGSPLWVIASVNLVTPEVGADPVIQGTLVDLTERKRAETAMAERHRLATLLAEIGVSLTGSESLRQGLQRCAEVLVRDIGASFARVWTVNNKDNVLELQASAAMYAHVNSVHARVPMDKFKIGQIAESGEPHLTNKMLEDPWVEDPEWARREGLVAFAGYPLKVEERVLGVVTAYARHPLTQATLQALASMSHSIAMFIERKQSEAALRESEERYRLLFERNLAGVFRATLFSRRILDCNDAYARILGYESRREVLDGGKAHEFYDPGDLEATRTRLLEKKALTNCEVCFRRKDQSPVWVLETVNLIEGRNGEGPILEGTLVDITERKQAEQALAQERDLLATLMDNLPDYIYFKDRQSRFIRTNRAHAKAFGLDDPALVAGRTDFDFFAIEHAQEAYDDEQEVIRSGVPMIAKEEKETWPDGRETWVSTTKMPFRDATGSIIGTFGVSHDITERKRADEALRASEERYRELFENATAPLFTTDLNGGLTSLNQVGEQITGYPREEATGMNLRQLVDPKHWQRVEQAHQRLLAGDTAVTLELEIKAKGGHRVMLGVKPRLIYKDGKPVAVQGIARDITGRDEAELELRQAQKLESVGRLASGIAHEINTPIQFVGDNTRFLQDSFGGLQTLLAKYKELCQAAASGVVSRGLVDEVRRVEEESDCAYLLEEIPKALTQTLEGVNRVATIVRAMKDFAHPESKEKAAADLNKALQSTLTVARNELKYVADVETDFGELPLVVCNISDLNQVFLNLLVNSAHAIAEVTKGSGQKGKIRVRTEVAGKTVLVTISDTGCGIPEAHRNRIFDPFFTTKEVGRGTGQGLAIARSVVVDRHKGSLTFESEVGKGTTFYIRLPLDSAESSERATPP